MPHQSNQTRWRYMIVEMMGVESNVIKTGWQEARNRCHEGDYAPNPLPNGFRAQIQSR
jgi:hypothetical protein